MTQEQMEDRLKLLTSIIHDLRKEVERQGREIGRLSGKLEAKAEPKAKRSVWADPFREARK